MNKSRCMFVITAKRNNEKSENIILVYFKEVFENPPSETHFYKDYGESGKAKVLFSIDEVQFRQWFCILSHEEAQDIIPKILQEKEITFSHINTTFALTTDLKNVEKKEYNQIDEYPTCSYYQIQQYNYEDYQYLKNIHFDSIKDDFTGNLSVIRDNIAKEIFPYDFIKVDKLKEYLENNIILINSEIFFLHNFRGISPVIKEDDPDKFIGVVECSPIDRENLLVSLYSENENITWEKKKEIVNPDTGRWIYNSDNQIGQGKIAYFDKRTKEIIAAESFSLIKSFSINVNPVSEIGKDLYGEAIMRGDKLKDPSGSKYPGNRVWYRESFPALNDIDFEKMVTSYLQKVIIYNGPKVIFYDPYCMGEIPLVNGVPKINPSLRVFINALIHALNSVEISEIGFFCRKKIVSDYWNSTEDLPEGYKLLLKQIKQIQKDTIFRFRLYDGTFHNRHIVNFDNEQTISISHSLNGIINSDELEVRELQGDEAKKVNSRIKRVWDKSKQSEIIYD